MPGWTRNYGRARGLRYVPAPGLLVPALVYRLVSAERTEIFGAVSLLLGQLAERAPLRRGTNALRGILYLCFIDESGTHGGSPVLVVGGIIIHEEDACHLQQRLDSFLFNKLHPLGHDHTEFELHASELRFGTK